MKEIDCHGLSTREMEMLLENLEKEKIREIKLITGKGNHSKNRPTMDYYSERQWRCPLKRTVVEYVVNQLKEGAGFVEYPSFVIWRRNI